jgi:ADP-ribose pyrophosphatase
VEPWRKLGERVVYDRFRRITSRTFELAGGETEEFEVIDLYDSVAVLALTPASEVVLVREFRPGPEQILLELPGGVVEANQTPIEAAHTELLEETGFMGELIHLGSLFKDGYATNVKNVVVGTDCRRVAKPERPELTEPVLVSLDQFRSHLRSGRLTDSDAAYRALDFLELI